MTMEGLLNITRMWVFSGPFQQSIVNLISQIPSIRKRQIVLFEEKEISLENCLFYQTTEPLTLCYHHTLQGINKVLSS